MDTIAPAAVEEHAPPPDTIELPGPIVGSLARTASVEEDEFMDDYLWGVNAYINDHVRFSDTKAGSVIVLAGAVLSLLYGGGLQRSFAGRPFAEWTVTSVAALLAFLALGGSVVTAAWSIRPRLVRVHQSGFIFWESVLAHGSADAFVRALNGQSRQELLDHLATQIYYVSLVCSRKFLWVARSIQLCLVGALLAAAVLVFR
ncbi:MAG TPA: Pycsar system effector family protein [Longimicrobiaceae bacterium]